MADDSAAAEEGTIRQHKIIVMGDGSAGKTSMIAQYCQDTFTQQYKQTIGLDWYSKQLTLPGNIHVMLKIWDIGGQSISGKMIPHHLEGADAIMLLYDVTNQSSFDNLEDWLDLIKKYRGDNMPHLALVANKLDLSHLRVVRTDAHNKFAASVDMSSHFICAKNGDQITITFRKIVAAITGIAMTKAEMQLASVMVKANIVQHDGGGNSADAGIPKPEKRLVGRKRGRSTVCSIQ